MLQLPLIALAEERAEILSPFARSSSDNLF
jgi:hypothetical protein